MKTARNQGRNAKRGRSARLVVGALLAGAISLGTVAGSAAADTSPAPVKIVNDSSGSPVRFTGGKMAAMSSGIRW